MSFFDWLKPKKKPEFTIEPEYDYKHIPVDGNSPQYVVKRLNKRLDIYDTVGTFKSYEDAENAIRVIIAGTAEVYHQ